MSGKPRSHRFVMTYDENVPLSHINLCFEGSPVHDPAGLEGLACLTNRMLLEGTHALKRAAFHEAVENLGTEVLTATSQNSVSIGGTILSRHRSQFIQLLQDAVLNPAHRQEDFDRVRREMLSEIELISDEDNYLARFWLRRKVFDSGHLANHALGTVKSLNSMTLDDVRSAHEKTYCQSRAWIGMSGDEPRDVLQSLMTSWVSALPQGDPLNWSRPALKAIVGRRVLLVHKPQRTQAQILLGHPSVPSAHPDEWHLRLATSAFGGSFTSRLVQEVRVKRGVSYDTYAHMASERSGGMYILGASADASRMVETTQVLLDEYDRFVHEGLDDEEIEFARESRSKGFPFTIETATLEMSQRLRGRLAGYSTGWLERYLQFLTQVTPDSVRSAVRKHLSPSSLWIVVVCTVDDATRSAFEALSGVESVDVIDYENRPASE